MENLNRISIDDLKSRIERMTNDDILNLQKEKEIVNVKSKIVNDIIVPNYYGEIQDTVQATKKWKKTSNIAELFSKILTGIATIIAFGAGAFTDYTFLSFIAGCIGTVSLVCQQFSTYARGEARERISQANKILQILGIDSIPDVMDEQ